MTNKKTKGFTLVELLVVIAIIVVLAGALFIVINPAKLLAKSRDSRRFSEITEVNKAFAASLAEGMIGLVSLGATVRNSCSNTDYTTAGAGWVGGFTGALGDYISMLPRDPKNISPNCYYFNMSVSGWEFNMIPESVDNAPAAINDGGNAGTSANCTEATMPNTNCRIEIGTDLTLI